jgi:hypothetical protein
MSHFHNPEDASSASYYQLGTAPKGPTVQDGYHQSTMLAGAETVMPLEKIYMLLNLPGPDATVRIDQPLKAHKLRIERVWFTLPQGSSLLAPGDSTLYMTFDEIANSSNVITSQTLSSVNNGVFHVYDAPIAQFPPPSQVNFPNGDPGQLPHNLMNRCVFAFPVFVPSTTVEANTLVVAENKSDLVHSFVGRSNGLRQLRVRLWNRVISAVVGVPDTWTPWAVIDTPMQLGSVAPPLPLLNAVRIFVEAHMWVEKRH